jgi:hypothetical protein
MLRESGTQLSPRAMALISSPMILSLLIVWTNEWHSWFWTSLAVVRVEGEDFYTGWTATYGPTFYLMSICMSLSPLIRLLTLPRRLHSCRHCPLPRFEIYSFPSTIDLRAAEPFHCRGITASVSNESPSQFRNLPSAARNGACPHGICCCWTFVCVGSKYNMVIRHGRNLQWASLPTPFFTACSYSDSNFWTWFLLLT